MNPLPLVRSPRGGWKNEVEGWGLPDAFGLWNCVAPVEFAPGTYHLCTGPEAQLALCGCDILLPAGAATAGRVCPECADVAAQVAGLTRARPAASPALAQGSHCGWCHKDLKGHFLVGHRRDQPLALVCGPTCARKVDQTLGVRDWAKAFR